MLPSVQELVKQKLPFLKPTQEPKIEIVRVEMYYDYFVGQLQRLETDLNDETKLSLNEKLFLAEITAYELCNRLAIEQKSIAIDITSIAVQPAKTIKKAKADVVETEYQILSDEQANRLSISMNQILQNLLRNLCNRAYDIGLSVPCCAFLDNTTDYDTPTYIIVE